MPQEMIDGFEIRMGGKAWLIPPLNTKRLRKLESKIANVQGGSLITMRTNTLFSAISILQEVVSNEAEGLSTEDLEQLTSLISKIQLTTSKVKEREMAIVADAIEVIHSALSRNYPELTIEDVEELVDLGNFSEVFQAVMGVSMLKKKSKLDPQSPSTGSSSTPTSPPEQAGPTEPSTT